MRRAAIVLVGLVLAAFVYGFLTMTDPSTGSHPEGSPAYPGSVEAPEVGPVTP
ncbi:MAG TPA: hypothetical protein VI276_01235 [Actinomycetota bacterium]